MSTFGTHYRVTTFGESHCASVGCIVDGVPPGMALAEADVQTQLSRRRPGQSSLTTPVSVRHSSWCTPVAEWSFNTARFLPMAYWDRRT